MARLVAGYYIPKWGTYPELKLALRRDENTKEVVTVQSPVRPRMYLPKSELGRAMGIITDHCKSPRIQTAKDWKFAHPKYRELVPVKIEVWNPKNIGIIRDKIFAKYTVDGDRPLVGEADIIFIRNLIRILKTGKALDVKGGKIIKTPDDFPSTKVLFIDIECSDKYGFARADRDAILSIQTCTMDGKIKVFSWHPDIKGSSEKAEVFKFLSYILEFDHLLGWCIEFDRRYLYDRVKFLGFNFEWRLFRFVDLERLYRGMHRLPWTVSLEFAVKKEKYKETRGYTLKKIKKYHELWMNDYDTFIERVTKHVTALRDLEEDYLLYSGRLRLSDLANLWVDNAFFPSTVVRNILLNDPFSGGTEWIFGCKDYTRGRSKKDRYRGARVIEPRKEFYNNVALLDFLSLYNRIIQSWNIGFDTISEDGAIHAPHNRYTTEFRSLFSRKLQWLEKLREEYKTLRKKAADEGDDIKYEAYDSAQYGTKVVLLVFYGVTGDKRSDIYIPELAEDITLLGQACLSYTEKEAENLNYPVAYGDTDSLILKFSDTDDDFEETLDKSTRFVKYLNKLYNDEFLEHYGIPDKWKSIEMKLEEIMYSCLFTAKKRYAYLKTWDVDHGFLDKPKLKVKGMETERHEWCDLSKVMLEKVLNMRLYRASPSEMYSYVKDVKDRFYAGEFDDLLVLSTGLGKPIEQYDSKLPHVRAASKLQDMGYPVRVRDKIDYVITGFDKNKSIVSPIIEGIPELNERAYEHYWNKKVFPPVERVIKGSMPSWQFEVLKSVKRRKTLSGLFKQS